MSPGLLLLLFSVEKLQNGDMIKYADSFDLSQTVCRLCLSDRWVALQTQVTLLKTVSFSASGVKISGIHLPFFLLYYLNLNYNLPYID